MSTKFWNTLLRKRMFTTILRIVAILVIAFPVTGNVYAAAYSPFVGQWEAIDVDGSNMLLTIGGRPAGPFRLTWTDDYISYCSGGAGIVRGNGWLNEGDPNLLEADIHLECLTSGATLDFHVTFRYHPAPDTLSIRYSFGQVTIWQRIGRPQALGWQQANADGFGDFRNMHIASLAVFGQYLYAGVWHWVDDETATAQIWRTPDGTNWEQVNETEANGAAALIAYKGYLYSGSWDGKVWRSQDGLNWEYITTDGFGGSNGIARFAVFKNVLYASTWSGTGTEIYRTTNGTRWTPAIDPGLSDPSNGGAIASEVFMGYLYWGVGNWDAGAQLWRTDGVTTKAVIIDGFGTAGNSAISSLATFGNYLYAGLWNPSGIQVWRSANGTNWEQVSGIGNPSIGPTSGLEVYDGQLYLVVENRFTGMEVWQTANGVDWKRVGFAGFSDVNNGWSYWDNATIVFRGNLYIATNNYSSGGEVWKAGIAIPQMPPPTLNLRVNYGHDWVESFYESGHMAWVTVTDSDGNMKAMTEIITESKWYWGGGAGFQTMDSVWFDADGNQMENPPDIQPNDWVYGWVDNGATAQVRIGEITGEINLVADSIEGTINAPWFTDPVQVECLDWGSGQDPPYTNKDGGFVLTNGEDPYSCSWAGEWDIIPGQTVGIGYFGPDGHWVANALTAPNPRIVASEAGDWFWTTDFYPGTLDLFIYVSADEGAALLWQGQSEADPWGFTIIGSDVHGQNLVPGNYLIVSDGTNQKELVLQPITINVFDTWGEAMAGTAPAGSEVWAAAGPQDWQERIQVQTDPVSGAWLADFTTIGFDITEEMRPSSYAHIYDEDGDANEGSTPPSARVVVQISDDWFRAENFTPYGELTFWVYDAEENLLSHPNRTWLLDSNGYVTINMWDLDEFLDLIPGYHVVVSDGSFTKEVVLEDFTFDTFNLSIGQLSGTAPAPSGRAVWAGIGWQDQDAWLKYATSGENGAWLADFGQPVPNEYWWVAAQIFDADGDASELRPSQIYPTIFAWLEWDQVDGHGWREGETVTLTINDGEHVLTQVAGPAKIVFDLRAAEHDLTIGDQVTMSDGLITKEILIPDLKVTDYNLGVKAVSGTYDPNLGFHTYVNGQSPNEVVFDGNSWTAYYNDLGPFMWGDATQRDADNDEVAATIHTPNPNLYALPDENKIFAQEWIAGFDLELTIYNSIGDVLHTDTKMVEPPSEVPWTVVIFEGFDIEPGQRIVLSQRGYERELLVSSLAVIGFNFATQQIMGTSDAGVQIFVRINGQDVPGEVGVDGEWIITHPQLAPGVWGEAIQPDGIDGDETRDGFQAQ